MAMLTAFRVIGRALRHLNGNGYLYVWANLAFLLLSVPIITMPAAWAGLCRLSYYAIRQPAAEWDDFVDGFKAFLKRGLLIGVFNLAFVLINWVNLVSTRGDSLGEWALRFVWLSALIGWFFVQFYAYPLYFAMKTPSLRGAFRNAAVMILLNPFFTLALAFALVILWSLSTILLAAWGLLTVSAMAIIANIAVQDRLRKAGFEPPPENVTVENETIYGGDSP
ncbi:MAG: hypothetical protein SF162_10195 [bacterium]|nr:hypothetical protein [bacterium]